MQIYLYKCLDDKNKLNKTLTNEKIIDLNIRKLFNFDTPTIKIKIDNFDYNYVKIDNRYYFVVNKNYIAESLIELNLKCDLLMTYKNELLKCSGEVVGTFQSSFTSSYNPTFDVRPKFKQYNLPIAFPETSLNVVVVANNRKGESNE